MCQLYQQILQTRYLAIRHRRPRPVNKFQIDLCRTVIPDNDVPWLSDTEFINAYRMTKSAFQRLLHAIENHPVFRRRRGPQQAPVSHQLMVLLHILGTAGSGASNHRARNHFHIGYGSVSNFKKRVITAIHDCLRDNYYVWPNENERKDIATEIQREFLLPNCVGEIDGTTFSLLHKPNRNDSTDFKGRKNGYTISGLFFFDHKRRVRYYNTGWAGSAHDNRIFTNSAIYTNQDQFFRHNEYITGDSAFQEEPFCVSSYKNPTGGTLRGTKAGFNTILGRLETGGLRFQLLHHHHLRVRKTLLHPLLHHQLLLLFDLGVRPL